MLHAARLTCVIGWLACTTCFCQAGERDDRPIPIQIELGRNYKVDKIALFPVERKSGSRLLRGYGFPVRYRLEVAADANFQSPTVIFDSGAESVLNPGNNVVTVAADGHSGRYVRLICIRPFVNTRPAGKDASDSSIRSAIFALSEFQVYSEGRNVALGATVTARDSFHFERRPLWNTRFLADTGWPIFRNVPRRLVAIARLSNATAPVPELNSSQRFDLTVQNRTTVWLIEDNTMFRRMVVRTLQREPTISVIGDFDSFEAVPMDRNSPDVILIDINVSEILTELSTRAIEFAIRFDGTPQKPWTSLAGPQGPARLERATSLVLRTGLLAESFSKGDEICVEFNGTAENDYRQIDQKYRHIPLPYVGRDTKHL